MMEEYLETFPRLASDIYKTAEKPCTIIFPGAKNLATNLIAPDGTIGIRLTSDPFCKKLIGLSAVPLVSTSANISGSAAPATFHEINSSICEQVDYIVKWRQDDTSPAKPSSIIKLEKDGSITTLRP
jgi:L-threonylcarbamoyladenylate synthase